MAIVMNSLAMAVLAFFVVLLGCADKLWASIGAEDSLISTQSPIGYFSVLIFFLAYIFVMAEEFIHLRKSKPVLLAAGLIWVLIGIVYASHGMSHIAETAMKHNIMEYSELLLFLLVAMTYINAMEERLVFESLRSWLVRSGFSYRQLFWITGTLSFIISPVADNLTTALLMSAVVLAVGKDNHRFIVISSINIVVGANAGGAFSPFGDITTLMVWQKGVVYFWTFFLLFIPSAVNFLVPAAIMHFAVPNALPASCDDVVYIKRGGMVIMGLFLLTIATAVSFHNFLGLPPMGGMMMGLAYLNLYAFYLKKTFGNQQSRKSIHRRLGNDSDGIGQVVPFDVFKGIARAEWDTLMFFYGVIMCVGGLGFIGYLAMVSKIMYVEWGATSANVAVGVLSAIVDNIPVMFAVLSMNPDMSLGQWLLVTLTAGVGGSLLSIGSAAGVALMGQARGIYTFFRHLKWSWAIMLGYAASIWVHFLVNKTYF
ncbi:MAG: sodium:proton antiporter NhaD [Magnetococcales bacterium]|nr:sodium:proton antiporter NhaD [Magnetococcales bacterium]